MQYFVFDRTVCVVLALLHRTTRSYHRFRPRHVDNWLVERVPRPTARTRRIQIECTLGVACRSACNPETAARPSFVPQKSV